MDYYYYKQATLCTSPQSTMLAWHRPSRPRPDLHQQSRLVMKRTVARIGLPPLYTLHWIQPLSLVLFRPISFSTLKRFPALRLHQQWSTSRHSLLILLLLLKLLASWTQKFAFLPAVVYIPTTHPLHPDRFSALFAVAWAAAPVTLNDHIIPIAD